jgi:hypothetical protein
MIDPPENKAAKPERRKAVEPTPPEPTHEPPPAPARPGYRSNTVIVDMRTPPTELIRV